MCPHSGAEFLFLSHFFFATSGVRRYGFLYRVVPTPGINGALVRTTIDQLIFAPTFLPVFFTALFTMEGHPQDIKPTLKRDFVSVIKANWMVWGPAQLINFSVVPPPLQVLFANVVSLGWNAYLSFASHKQPSPAAEPLAQPAAAPKAVISS